MYYLEDFFFKINRYKFEELYIGYFEKIKSKLYDSLNVSKLEKKI